MQQMIPASTINRIGPDRPLRADEEWASAWFDRFSGEELISRIRTEVKADQAGNLYLEESENEDGTGATQAATVAVVANTAAKLPWTDLTKQYYRLRYVNGLTAQTKRMYLFMVGAPLAL